MPARLLLPLLATLALWAIDVGAQATTRPQLLVGLGISGQRDGDRDLGSPGFTAELGVAWRLGRSLRARLSAHVFALPESQVCSCDFGDSHLSAQGTYGAVFAVRSLSPDRPLYWLVGASLRRGGYRSWNEETTAGLLGGIGWTPGASRHWALEARYEHFASPLGATRALLPLSVIWHP